MFGRKKDSQPPPPRKGGGNKLMAQMGIMDPNAMADMEADIYGDDDDAELEAELALIAGEDAPKAKTSPKKTPMSMNELNKIVANTMNYAPEDDDDDAADVDDPDLLAELQMLSTSSGSPEPPPPVEVQNTSLSNSQDVTLLIQERISMYQSSIEVMKTAGDSSKARRLERGLKTLRDLMRHAQAGKPVAEDDIPPAISISARPTPVSSPLKEQSTFPSPPNFTTAAPISSSSETSPIKQTSPLVEQSSPSSPNVALAPGDKRSILLIRRDQYRQAALAAKRDGDDATALRYIKTAKQFDVVITAFDEGKPVDLSHMPPALPEFGGSSPAREVARSQGSSAGPSQAELATAAAAAAVASQTALSSPEEEDISLPEMAIEDKKKLFNAPTDAGTILEALEQRLEKYRASALQAKNEENSSKARRMTRIVKQYEDAVKAHKAGRHVDYMDLPKPPGFPPIPCDSPAKQPPPVPSPFMSPATSNNQIAGYGQQQSPPTPQRAPAAPVTQSPVQHVSPPSSVQQPATIRPELQKQHSILSRAEQQAMFLQDRQLAFKKEALKAKQKGDIALAKKYLRQAMGFDQMIEASKSGLPVDMAQVPALPGISDEKLEFITSEDVKQGDRETTYKNLEQELITQIRTCTNNVEHFTKLGDVTTAGKFGKICANARKDLDSLKNAFKHGDPVPRFHYESRTYTLVKSCPELGDDDLEITMVRGINYHLPPDYSASDLDTYIKYELPFPTDDVQKGYSDTVKNTNNPEHNQAFTMAISRKSRSFLRFLKHKTLKIEVHYKRGFFKGDKILGTAQVKLQPLENTCVLHESYDLTDGRRAVGGKVEVKLRVREPFLGKQVEEVKEKWLIIDHFDRVLPPSQETKQPATKINAPAPPAPATPAVSSIKVLEYEKDLLDRQIQQMAARLSRQQDEVMRRKSAELGQRADKQRDELRKGGANAYKLYANSIEKSMPIYLSEASALFKQGNRDKAQLLVTKKKLIEKEVEGIRSQLAGR